MPNIHTFKEFAEIAAVNGKVTAALGGETGDTLTSTFAKMENYDKVVAIAVVGHVVSGQVVSLKLYEATATDGGGSATISGASDTYTSTSTDDVDILFAEVNAEDLSSGSTHVGAKVSTDDADGTEYVGLVILPMNPRYAQESMIASKEA